MTRRLLFALIAWIRPAAAGGTYEIQKDGGQFIKGDNDCKEEDGERNSLEGYIDRQPVITIGSSVYIRIGNEEKLAARFVNCNDGRQTAFWEGTWSFAVTLDLRLPTIIVDFVLIVRKDPNDRAKTCTLRWRGKAKELKKR